MRGVYSVSAARPRASPRRTAATSAVPCRLRAAPIPAGERGRVLPGAIESFTRRCAAREGRFEFDICGGGGCYYPPGSREVGSYPPRGGGPTGRRHPLPHPSPPPPAPDPVPGRRIPPLPAPRSPAASLGMSPPRGGRLPATRERPARAGGDKREPNTLDRSYGTERNEGNAPTTVCPSRSLEPKGSRIQRESARDADGPRKWAPRPTEQRDAAQRMEPTARPSLRTQGAQRTGPEWVSARG